MQAGQLLRGNPALTMALFQALTMMKLVDPAIVQQVMQQQQAPKPATPAAPATSLDQQRAFLMQIMAMTQEQIDALPAEQRDKIIQLRAQLSHRQ